ncbi:unnamed protein product [Bursaphelenchus okinawaensis]|uniref:Uncharacterized protein n=1 Tax=Bursaphelenchus okinawaensis TaxID=465554 RepID=A0A811LRD3_9BILA|nr:unnamed protein product [Bursaphelenchus okinawaensis]CAG9127347.1 unnamed protein product [Bursaphelenchus okinawaensis]
MRKLNDSCVNYFLKYSLELLERPLNVWTLAVSKRYADVDQLNVRMYLCILNNRLNLKIYSTSCDVKDGEFSFAQNLIGLRLLLGLKRPEHLFVHHLSSNTNVKRLYQVASSIKNACNPKIKIVCGTTYRSWALGWEVLVESLRHLIVAVLVNDFRTIHFFNDWKIDELDCRFINQQTNHYTEALSAIRIKHILCEGDIILSFLRNGTEHDTLEEKITIDEPFRLEELKEFAFYFPDLRKRLPKLRKFVIAGQDWDCGKNKYDELVKGMAQIELLSNLAAQDRNVYFSLDIKCFHVEKHIEDTEAERIIETTKRIINFPFQQVAKKRFLYEETVKNLHIRFELNLINSVFY